MTRQSPWGGWLVVISGRSGENRDGCGAAGPESRNDWPKSRRGVTDRWEHSPGTEIGHGMPAMKPRGSVVLSTPEMGQRHLHSQRHTFRLCEHLSPNMLCREERLGLPHWLK